MYCEVIETNWNETKTVMQAIRRAVFIDEQKVPEDMEWDGQDEQARHFLALDVDGQPVGTVRLLSSGQISRLSVLQPFRSQGVGRALLGFVEMAARAAGMDEIFLHAQTHATSFYESAGFITTGGIFLEANIPHRQMFKELS
jgi:predicted GNAT family N-acyltransferase